jgi:hypothetical protein
MDFPQDQIDELKQIAPSLNIAEEGGYTFILIEKLKLPDHCSPTEIDALLCPTPRDGYHSRLFFSSMVTGGPQRNWNGNIRVLGKNWHAVSWRTKEGLRLAQMLMIHLNALRC